MIADEPEVLEEPQNELKFKVNLTYPNDLEYDYFTKLETIDLDAEKDNDIATGNGFLISKSLNTNKKDMKNPDGIYSDKFGPKLGDIDAYSNRYMCRCGYLKGRVNHDMTCPVCHTKVKYVDDNFEMFGWIVLNDKYHIIHPKFYNNLDYIFGQSKFNTERKRMKGSKLQNILNYSPEIDQDGIARECEFKPDNEPFYGIGMMEFYNRFDEILDYYYKKNPKKKEYYDEIQRYRNIVFCHSIPVFTTHLRPVDVRDGYLYFEPTNGLYNMINKHVHNINKDQRKMDQNEKIKNSELYKVQMKFMDLVNEVYNILSGKKGQLRSLVGGRYNFSCRAVIRQDPALRVDQILLPYVMLVKTLQQKIINILMRTYNISPSDAYTIWNKALAEKDEMVCKIIQSIIDSYPEGLPCI